ncbi:protein OS-9-like protein [Iris pallida]|uniref:Protein OS-9-like protein n=1 Tax=Iris pallida TaxID=29817 RepID=A0AAX6EZ27_IRIPA|nr:protein OS-9-like protein [Iris pallida]
MMDGDDFVLLFFSMDGASLAVIWGHISEEVTKAAGEHAMATLNKIRDDRHGRWKALGSLKSILPSVDYLWVVKSHSIDLILSKTDGTNPVESYEVPIDFSSLMPSIFAVLKGIQRTMIGAPDASLRKKAFLVLKKAWMKVSSH